MSRNSILGPPDWLLIPHLNGIAPPGDSGQFDGCFRLSIFHRVIGIFRGGFDGFRQASVTPEFLQGRGQLSGCHEGEKRCRERRQELTDNAYQGYGHPMVGHPQSRP